MDVPDDSLTAGRRNPYLTVLASLAVLSLVAAVILEVYAYTVPTDAPAARVALVAQFAALVFSASFLVTGALFWRRDERGRLVEGARAAAADKARAEAHRRAELER